MLPGAGYVPTTSTYLLATYFHRNFPPSRRRNEKEALDYFRPLQNIAGIRKEISKKSLPKVYFRTCVYARLFDSDACSLQPAFSATNGWNFLKICCFDSRECSASIYIFYCVHDLNKGIWFRYSWLHIVRLLLLCSPFATIWYCVTDRDVRLALFFMTYAS